MSSVDLTSEQQSSVLYEKKGKVAYITLNRPQVLNAMDLDMHARLLEIWNDFNADENIWIGVISGAGDKAFSVGQDIKELRERYKAGEPFSSFGSGGRPGWPRLTERFDIHKPIIAMVDGYAMGGGFELALACDLIIASDNSVFALPEAKLGLIQGAGGIFRLTKQLPLKKAMGYLLTGMEMSANEAFDFGLVNEVVPAEQLAETVECWLEKMLLCSPMSVRAIKNTAYQSASLSVEEAFSQHYHAEQRRLESADLVEGVNAFLEKRRPEWEGE